MVRFFLCLPSRSYVLVHFHSDVESFSVLPILYVSDASIYY